MELSDVIASRRSIRKFIDEEAIKAYLSMNVAITVEHIALKAVDLSLGHHQRMAHENNDDNFKERLAPV